MTTPIPPDTVAAGQTGHIAAHNAISDVLTLFEGQLSEIPAVRYGTATLAAGTVSVALASVDSSTVVLVSRMAPSGTLGHLSVPSVSNGTGFTINSSSMSDASVVAWIALG
jgi:selenophosphate synthase